MALDAAGDSFVLKDEPPLGNETVFETFLLGDELIAFGLEDIW